MTVLVKLDCDHTVLLHNHPWAVDAVYYCGRCGDVKPVVDFIYNQDQRDPVYDRP